MYWQAWWNKKNNIIHIKKSTHGGLAFLLRDQMCNFKAVSLNAVVTPVGLLDHTITLSFTGDAVMLTPFMEGSYWSMWVFFPGAVSTGGDVSVHGSAAGSSRSVEPAGTQSVCSGHHGRGMGERNSHASCLLGYIQQSLCHYDVLKCIWKETVYWSLWKMQNTGGKPGHMESRKRTMNEKIQKKWNWVIKGMAIKKNCIQLYWEILCYYLEGNAEGQTYRN